MKKLITFNLFSLLISDESFLISFFSFGKGEETSDSFDEEAAWILLEFGIIEKSFSFTIFNTTLL